MFISANTVKTSLSRYKFYCDYTGDCLTYIHIKEVYGDSGHCWMKAYCCDLHVQRDKICMSDHRLE